METVKEISKARKSRRQNKPAKAATGVMKNIGEDGLSINPMYKLDLKDNAGFSVATLDLNELLVKNSEKSFLIRVTGDSMKGASIDTGDILLVDCASQPEDGKIIVAAINNELLVKRIRFRSEGIFLEAENEKYLPIKIKESDKFDVWGVVSSVIKMYY